MNSELDEITHQNVHKLQRQAGRLEIMFIQFFVCLQVHHNELFSVSRHQAMMSNCQYNNNMQATCVRTEHPQLSKKVKKHLAIIHLNKNNEHYSGTVSF